MYNLSSKFNTFYGKHVVLSKDQKSELFNKKNINIKRLKEGLAEYNSEKGTNYKLAEEPVVQGSVAMSTVIQKEENDYDIDVAIIFEKDKIPDGITATKNIVVEALKKKCKQFNTEPEAKINCIRINYSSGYHIDFAIYRRYKGDDDNYVYEHCGSEWRERDPRAITQWFLNANREKEYKLRDVVRLLKMFSKSRDSWKSMPGGLIQSVLAKEQFQEHDRMDERFYHTVKAIRDRLKGDKEVLNPTDEDKSLKLVSKDNAKMDNLYNRLNDKLSKLDVLFDSSCTYNQAIEAWEEFFNHSYWTGQKKEEKVQVENTYASVAESEEFTYFRETEEFIQYLMPVNYQYEANLDCRVSKGGKFIGYLKNMIKRKEVIYPGYSLDFRAETNVPEPYEVYWKVRNKGEVAKEKDDIRGQIVPSKNLTHSEGAKYKGKHYVECYIVKDGECVAKDRIHVHIKL